MTPKGIRGVETVGSLPNPVLIAAHGRDAQHVIDDIKQRAETSYLSDTEMMTAEEYARLQEGVVDAYALVTSPLDFFGNLIVDEKMPREEIKIHIGHVARGLTVLLKIDSVIWVRDPSNQPKMAAQSIVEAEFDGFEKDSARELLATINKNLGRQNA